MELDLPDYPAASKADDWRCGWLFDPCCDRPGDALVIGTEIGLAIEDCDGMQVEVTP